MMRSLSGVFIGDERLALPNLAMIIVVVTSYNGPKGKR